MCTALRIGSQWSCANGLGHTDCYSAASVIQSKLGRLAKSETSPHHPNLSNINLFSLVQPSPIHRNRGNTISRNVSSCDGVEIGTRCVGRYDAILNITLPTVAELKSKLQCQTFRSPSMADTHM